jgi:hypothetical protein
MIRDVSKTVQEADFVLQAIYSCMPALTPTAVLPP